MCGITGIINLSGEQPTLNQLEKMSLAIAHRGPDGEGKWIEENIGFGHRRLAVIDLTEGGKQPMKSSDGRFVLIYNGEVYNYMQLRKELENHSIKFQTQSDCEVLLQALIHWGTEALSMINGMFALALWDRREKKLLLARDRYGIKPLYFCEQGGSLIFGSEIKAIIASGKCKVALNTEGLLEYFTFQNFLSENTLYQNISLLPAGNYGILDLRSKNPKLDITQYWDFHFEEPKGIIDPSEWEEELGRLFYKAVNNHLVGDVEIGSYLSGGMDSASIVAVASRKNLNLKTFTVGFDTSGASQREMLFDERLKAQVIAKHFGTSSNSIELNAQDVENCNSLLVHHLEEPRIGQSYPNLFAAKPAKKHVKVVLSGSGGDELFAGYPWRYFSGTPNSNFESYIDNYYKYWQRLLPNSKIKKLFTPIWGEVGEISTRDIFRDVFKNHNNDLADDSDYINHSLYFEAKTFLHSLFVVEDKLSMAYGLESRVPFMDNELVEFAMRCPVSLKLNRANEEDRIDENIGGRKKEKYFERTKNGKIILRKIMENQLPLAVINAEKQGFSSPDASWFKHHNRKFIEKSIKSPNSRILTYFDVEQVNEIVDQHMSGSTNNRLAIWSLLYFEEWLQQNL